MHTVATASDSVFFQVWDERLKLSRYAARN
jgi:hypothetical protein